jgi:hypothetical protein
MTAPAYVRRADGSLKNLGFVSADAAESGPGIYEIEPTTAPRRSAVILDQKTYRKWLVSLTHRQRCVEVVVQSHDDVARNLQWWGGTALTYGAQDSNLYAMTPDGRFSTILMRERTSNLLPLGDRSFAVVAGGKLLRYDLPAYQPAPEPPVGDGHENDCPQSAPPVDIGATQ